MSELTCILRKSFIDSVKKIKTFRYISATLMVLGLVLAVTSGIDRLICDIGENVTIGIVPHIFSDKYFSAFYGIIVCYLLSEIPYFNSNELYYITRMGRKKWFLSKALSILILMLLFTITTFLICIVAFIPRISFSLEWGKVIKTMAYSTNIYSYNLLCQPSAVILGKYEPVQAIVLSLLMAWGVSTMIGYIMFALSIFFSRFVSTVFALSVALLGLSGGLFYTVKFLTYFSLCTWFRLSIYGSQIFTDWFYPHMWVYVTMTLGISILCVVLSAIKIKHTEFDWINES